MAISNIGGSDISLNGYYLKPTVAYKASTIFGGDEKLAAMMEKGMTVSFTDILKEGLGQVNSLQFAADDLAAKFAAGETDNIHEVMIAGQKADMALQLAVALRNKLIEAYQEITRMQI